MSVLISQSYCWSLSVYRLAEAAKATAIAADLVVAYHLTLTAAVTTV